MELCKIVNCGLAHLRNWRNSESAMSQECGDFLLALSKKVSLPTSEEYLVNYRYYHTLLLVRRPYSDSLTG
jgi:hypothetical protein